MNTFENVINGAATVFGDAGEFIEDGVYTADFDGVKIALFTSNNDSGEVYFRAKVASLDGTDDPGKLCEGRSRAISSGAEPAARFFR